jgi:nucleoside-diphosphate-sugar epimerase
LASLILDLTDSDSEVVFTPSRNGDVQDSVGDIECATRQLGYCREYDIKKGLAETIAWFRDHAARRCAA